MKPAHKKCISKLFVRHSSGEKRQNERKISQRLHDQNCHHVPKFIVTWQIANSGNISTRFGKSSTLVMFSESAIGQHLLDNPLCTKNYNDKKDAIFSFCCLSALLIICFSSRSHLIMQAKFMPPKKVC